MGYLQERNKEKMVKVAIALPVPNQKIIGGYKVAYEYANYLEKNGLDVSVVYNAHNGENSKGLPKFIVLVIRWMIGVFGPKWFKLAEDIHKIVVSRFTDETFLNYDIVIATAAETVEHVNKANGIKVYFVQGFEDWGRSKEAVLDTYRMDMKKITISKWLKEIIDNVSSTEAIYIPNGIDNNIFLEKIPYDKRGEHSLCTLFHWDERKGCDVALKIIYRLKERYPDFEAFLFGAPKRENEWPEWIHYTEKAKPSEVADAMNHAKIFLCTSRQEGFGLTGLESIFCGCVLVTTDCQGIREYASQKNAYLCGVDQEQELFDSVCHAFDNEKESKLKRQNCVETLTQFDANKSKKRFYEEIINCLN